MRVKAKIGWVAGEEGNESTKASLLDEASKSEIIVQDASGRPVSWHRSRQQAEDGQVK